MSSAAPQVLFSNDHMPVKTVFICCLSTMVDPVRAPTYRRGSLLYKLASSHIIAHRLSTTVSASVYLLLFLELQQPSRVRQHQQPNHFLL